MYDARSPKAIMKRNEREKAPATQRLRISTQENPADHGHKSIRRVEDNGCDLSLWDKAFIFSEGYL